MSSPNESQSEKILTFNTSKSIETARAYCGLVGAIPSSFTSAIRTLMSEHEKNNGKAGSAGRYTLLRFLKSQSMLAAAYYAGLTFQPEKLSKPEKPFARAFVEEFSAADLAAIIGMHYLYRRARTLVDDESRPDFIKSLLVESELGAHIGKALPKVQLGFGLLTGGLPWLAPMLFSKHDAKAYKLYSRHLRQAKLEADPIYEMQTWGCTRYDIASVFVQLLGLGIKASEALGQALAAPESQIEALPSESYKFRITQLWIAALLKTGEPPSIAHRGEFYPTRDALQVLAQQADGIRGKGSKYSWLEKSKDSISPESTPLLFPQGSVSRQEPMDTEVPEELPEELLQDISIPD